ncbi:MAG TPA: hypothetical protein VK658_05070 [Chryseolinea sp.]|nr:hypothetical protein [Chryseolinea sp.]
MVRTLIPVGFLLAIALTSSAQVNKKIRTYEKTFQLSIFPGISTNGVSSGSYYNTISLNLFGGLSAGNRLLELGLFTNSNLKSSNGIQIAGLANIVGANAFVNLSQSEERTLINKEEFEVNEKGIQVAGLLNYVLNHASGIQFTAGLNTVGNSFKGLQLAGIGNSAGETIQGVQLAGLYNIAGESVAGFQISALFNYTNAQLSGMQLGLINKARWIKGAKSTPPTKARGIQIGVVNISAGMDCWQIGLVNVGGATRGKQIGIVNLFEKYGSKERTRMGTPMGLLNFGSRGTSLKVFYNEIFPWNVEFSTGNCLNCSWILGSEMPYDDDNQIYNQNVLIAGYDGARQTWGFGYGFQKVLYNKATIKPSPLNKKRVISYGAKVMHLNRSLSYDKSFNLLTRLNVDYGRRIKFLYLFGGVSMNYFIFEGGESGAYYEVRSIKIHSGTLGAYKTEMWPGYSIGVQLSI